MSIKDVAGCVKWEGERGWRTECIVANQSRKRQQGGSETLTYFFLEVVEGRRKLTLWLLPELVCLNAHLLFFRNKRGKKKKGEERK